MELLAPFLIWESLKLQSSSDSAGTSEQPFEPEVFSVPEVSEESDESPESCRIRFQISHGEILYIFGSHRGIQFL